MDTLTRDALARIMTTRRDQLRRAAAGMEDALERFAEEPESESEERAQETLLSDMLEQLDGRDRHAIDEIDAAFGRIAAGTYGWCERCALAIPGARLNAVPETRLCLRCATA